MSIRIEPMSSRSSQSPSAKSQAKVGKPVRDRVFEVAADLFYKESIRAVGVETIVKQAGVAKISLYRCFASKDVLIVAYLENKNAVYWRKIDDIMAVAGEDPRRQLRALLRHIGDRTTTPGYRGCPFINYVSEFPDPAHPGHRIVEKNKREMRQRLLSLSKAMDVLRPTQLADALFLLIEGAYASSQTLGGRNGPAAKLLWAADTIIASNLSN
jgi:AcrR family transcriptional regulator